MARLCQRPVSSYWFCFRRRPIFHFLNVGLKSGKFILFTNMWLEMIQVAGRDCFLGLLQRSVSREDVQLVEKSIWKTLDRIKYRKESYPLQFQMNEQQCVVFSVELMVPWSLLAQTFVFLLPTAETFFKSPKRRLKIAQELIKFYIIFLWHHGQQFEYL
jgi:hypothetical protein